MKRGKTPTIQIKIVDPKVAELIEKKAAGRSDISRTEWYVDLFVAGLEAYKPVVAKAHEEKPIKKAKEKLAVKKFATKKSAAPVPPGSTVKRVVRKKKVG